MGTVGEHVQREDYYGQGVVLHCGNSGEFSTRSLRPLHVCKARRRHRYAVVLQTKDDADIGHRLHRYFRNAVVVILYLLIYSFIKKL